MSTAPTPHRFTAAEFQQMGVAGIFTEDDRVELVEGEIIEMAALGNRHVRAVNRLGRLLFAATGDDLTVSIQNPVRLGEHDEPEPDLVVARGADGIPDANNVLLVIEVADTSREYDRGRKFPRYAAAGIPEVWLIDVLARAIERHTEPRGRRYRVVAPAGQGQALTSTVLPTLTIAVDAILGTPDERV